MMDRKQRQRQRRPMLTMAIAVCCIAACTAFTPPLQHQPSLQQQHASTGGRTTIATARKRSRTATTTAAASTTSSALQAKKSQSQPQPTADFEYQELQIQMDAMMKQNVKPSELDPPKRNELKGYVEQILTRRLKNKKSVDSSVPLDVRLRSSLPGSKWRMAFTTQALMAEALPKDATITLTFASGTGSAATGSNKVEYGLDFFKTLALKRLVAKSTYSVMEATNPDAATVQIIYEKIVTDVMGFSNVGIGMFGMLKGRKTYIQTVFFDNNLWIESGVDESSNFGETYYNVYARDTDGDKDDGEEEDENWQK